MKKFVCTVCGYVCQGEQPPENCPVCRQPREKFREEALEGGEVSTIELSSGKTEQKEDVFSMELSYDKNFYRVDESCRYMEEIHQMAVTGNSVNGAMGTQMPMPSWDDILILGAQLNPAPLDENAPVTTMTVIGKHAKKPMIIENPVYISHMSLAPYQKKPKFHLQKARQWQKLPCAAEKAVFCPKKKRRLTNTYLNISQISTVLQMKICVQQTQLKSKSDKGQSLVWEAICPAKK